MEQVLDLGNERKGNGTIKLLQYPPQLEFQCFNLFLVSAPFANVEEKVKKEEEEDVLKPPSSTSPLSIVGSH